MTDRAIRELARDLANLKSQVRALSTQPQLAYSSIEGGAVQSYDDDGTLRAVVGTLPDGTQGTMAVNGPPPPAPSAPTLVSQPRGFAVTWDGYNADGTDIQPLDWSRTEVHVSIAGESFTPTPSTLKGTIETPQGGTYHYVAGAEFTGDMAQDYWVKLVARNTSGTSSSASEVSTIRLGQVQTEDIAPFAVQVTQLQSNRHFLY